jgi:hypothetical protein
MLKLDSLIELVAELVRVLIVEEISELVRKQAGGVRLRRQPRGMPGIHRHIHHTCRRRLLNRLSTTR